MNYINKLLKKITGIFKLTYYNFKLEVSYEGMAETFEVGMECSTKFG